MEPTATVSEALPTTMSNKPAVNVLRKVVIEGLLICGLGICVEAMDRFLKPFQRGFFCGDTTLMYPFMPNTVTVPMFRAVGLSLNMFAFLVCEWVVLRKERSDVRCLGVRIAAWIIGFYCVLASFGLGLCFSEIATNITKIVAGRLRPFFFDVCKPSVDCEAPEWQNRYILPQEFHCTGHLTKQYDNVRMSFVSGHSSWAAYTMVYLALYLERRVTWQGTRMVRHGLQFIVLMLSLFTALTRVSDYHHHWSDVVFGYFLGASIAVLMWKFGTDIVKKRKNNDVEPVQEIPFTIPKPVST